MKKNRIALLLSVVLLASGAVTVPVRAEETAEEAVTAEETVAVDEAAAEDEVAAVDEAVTAETSVMTDAEAALDEDAALDEEATVDAEAALDEETAVDAETSNGAANGSTGSSGSFNGNRYTIFWDDWGGSCYTFSEAGLLCEQEGGHLVTINSPEEETFVRNLLANDPMMIKIMSYKTGMYSGCWIGAVRNSTSEAWRWINGEVFNYPGGTANWNSGALRISYLGEQYTLSQTGDPKLALSMGFICEWEGEEEEDLQEAEVELNGLLTDGNGDLCHAYTGSPVRPAVRGVKLNNRALTEGTDYEVQYGANQDFGEGTVTVTGIGGYTGSVTKTFRIVPGKTGRGDMFNLANNVKVTWKAVPGAKYYKVYRSGVKAPVIVTSGLVGWDKTPGLVNGRKYTYKIVASLTGAGDSGGDSPLSYSKVMYRLQTVVIRSAKNTGPGKVTVKFDKTTSGDSYVLQYCERKDMVGAKTKVVPGANNTSYVIGGLRKGKTYYISIRVRKKVNGIDYYTTFGVPKEVKVKY